MLEAANAQTKLTTNVGNTATLNQVGRTNENPLHSVHLTARGPTATSQTDGGGTSSSTRQTRAGRKVGSMYSSGSQRETETKGPETYSLKIATKGPETNSKDGSSMVAGAEEGEGTEGEKGSDKSHSQSGTSTVE